MIFTFARYAFTFRTMSASWYILLASGAFLTPPFLFMVAYFPGCSFSFIAMMVSGTFLRGAEHMAVKDLISLATSRSFSKFINPSTLVLLPMSINVRSLATMGYTGMRGGLTASDLIMFLYLLKFLLGSMIRFKSDRSLEYFSGTLSQVSFSLETAVWFRPDTIANMEL